MVLDCGMQYMFPCNMQWFTQTNDTFHWMGQAFVKEFAQRRDIASPLDVAGGGEKAGETT